MQTGDFSGAGNILERVLDHSPEEPEALYMHAVCLRYQGQLHQALGVLKQLQEVAPQYARAFQETGHTYRALKDDINATAAYKQAVALNPGLMASWKALAELERAGGNVEASEIAARHYRRLAQLPKELVSVTSMLHEGRLFKAEHLCRAFLQRHPHHVEAMRLLALLGTRLHVLDDAEFLLESCLEFEPDNAFARFDYVNVLNKRQKFRRALEQAHKLREAQPGNPSFETAYANQCMAIGDFEQALAVYDKVLEALPDNPGLHLSRGHALKTIGNQEGAVAAYQAAYRAKPDFGDAFWSLANLKTYRFDDDELRQMEDQERQNGTTLVDCYHLCFALGKAWEDRGEYARSFEFYHKGNQFKQSELRYDPDRIEAEMDRQKVVCTPELFSKREGQGHPAPDPIFIVGLPRAGSTLIEQILASHSQVDGTMELPNILALVHRLNGRRRVSDEPRYPDILEELPAEKLREFGEAFIKDTRIHRGQAPFFIDKMPNNFRHIGLIHLMLPNAKIIDARRDPMACCFSGYKQLFAEGQEFSYSLEHLGRYYRAYIDLMDHWNAVLSDKILLVRYEEVVSDLEAQVHRMLDFLGLPFESACLEFHKTERSVRTASSEQVRQPLYTRGMAQWQYFEPWLGPLKEALGLEPTS